MSGTSLDGVDAVLVVIHTGDTGELLSAQLESHIYLPYSEEVRKKISHLCIPGKADINDLTYAHYGLSHWYAETVRMLITDGGYTAEDIDAVSMHGQTVWHAPEAIDFPGPNGSVAVKGTLQLGNAQAVSLQIGMPVISDLRSADLAVGGEGAPLAPYIDFLLFGSNEEGRAVQNIGGIGNVTVLPKEGTQKDVFAFDTGPGNMILDAVIQIGTQGKLEFDDQGTIAAKGRVSEKLVKELMDDPYFRRKPPKSTGREVYGQEYTKKFMSSASKEDLTFEDTAATAAAFTAESIARSYRDYVLPQTSIAKVLVCGGGARNRTLLAMLQDRIPAGTEVTTTEAFGIPDQAREAMAFAVLGHESLMGRPGNLPAVTGAQKHVVLGMITLQNI